MSTTNLGRIAFLFRGIYYAATQYDKLDIVRTGGAGYTAIQPSIGVMPGTDETKFPTWKLFEMNSYLGT